ncbi:MAG: IS200/IS605 family transposase [Bacteroidetes bacterium]|nr:IS200/IS605 family transposase [Bacteroidota bacterium]
MPYIKIWIHLIFSTKNRDQLIHVQLKPQLLKHIKEDSIKKNIFIDFMNCVSDHIHLLISLNSEQSISKVAQLIKGESSHWVNDNKLQNYKFEWQDEYIAVSVSNSMVNKVRDYIWNQEEHHRKKSFAEEYEMFLEKYGFKKIMRK